jgi:hypothetical protein
MTKKLILVTFDKPIHARGEFDKFANFETIEKANRSTLDLHIHDRIYMFRVVTDIDDALRVGLGARFDTVHFNGLIDPDAREFLMSRIIGVN